MTDYLELLLDAWQDEDENEPFVWKRTRTGNRRLTGEVEAERQAVKGESTGIERQPLRRERVGAELVEGREAASWMEKVPGKAWAADPEERLAVLERAVSRGRQLQVMRERNRERADAVQAAGGQEMRGRSAVPGVQRGLAGLLDAAFERDARRYDGPLGLF